MKKDIFLEIADKKKLKLLKKIYYTKNHACFKYTLLEQLNITDRTLQETLTHIEEDLIAFNYQEAIKITFHNKKQLYKIDISEDASLDLLFIFYLERSIKFQLLKGLLTNSLDDISSTAKRFYTSYSSLRRSIFDLDSFFSTYGLSIKIRGKIELVGNELVIRTLFTLLYLNAYSGSKWPFSFLFFEITQLLEKVPNEIYPEHSLDRTYLLHYYLAITVIRLRSNCFTEDEASQKALYNGEQGQKSALEFTEFKKNLHQLAPTLSRQQLEQEARLIVSGVICFGSYQSIEKIPTFFYTDEQLLKIHFMDDLLIIMEHVLTYFQAPLSSEAKELLLYRLSTIHYRLYLFQEQTNTIGDLWYASLYENIDGIKNIQLNILNDMVSTLLAKEGFAYLKPYSSYLIQEYFYMLEGDLSLKYLLPPINILFLSSTCNRKLMQKHYLHLDNEVQVNIYDHLTPEVDLIISNFVIFRNIMNKISIHQETVHVNDSYFESDYLHVREKIEQILEKKSLHFLLEKETT